MITLSHVDASLVSFALLCFGGVLVEILEDEISNVTVALLFFGSVTLAVGFVV